MFQMSFGECLLVIIVAICVFGPEKLPALAKITARCLGRVKHYLRRLQNELDKELNS